MSVSTRPASLVGLLGLVAVVWTLGGACAGEAALPGEEALDASRESFGSVDSVLLRMYLDVEYEGESQSTFTEVGYESDEIMFTRSVIDDGATDALGGFSESVLIADDLYLRAKGRGWYVLSPWSEGALPDAAAGAGIDDLGAYYLDELLPKVEELSHSGSERIEDQEYLRYNGTFVSGYGPKGPATFWLDKETYLPRKLEITVSERRTTYHMVLEFIDYDLPVELPSLPEDVRPYRDFELPDAPCSGNAFAACLAPQDALAGIASDFCDGEGRRVCLVPYGRVDPNLIANLVAYYREQYGLAITVVRPAELPEDLANPLRGQIDAGDLIEHMTTEHGAVIDQKAVYIGITPVDLYNKDRHYQFVFGSKLGWGSPYGVISTFRMNPKTYSDPTDPKLFESRVRKMFTKYIGLLYYGLEESPDPKSPLSSSIGGLEALDNVTEPLVLPPASR